MIKESYPHTPEVTEKKRPHYRLRQALAVSALGITGVTLAPHAGETVHALYDKAVEMQSLETHGSQTVIAGTGDTLDALINEHVDGGASHTGEVRVYTIDHPQNADTFEDGILHAGEEVVLPKSVE